MERPVLLIGQHGQNHPGQEQEFGKGENLVRSDGRRQLFESRFQVQQDQARHGERGRKPEMPVADQRAHQKRGQPRHLRGHAGNWRPLGHDACQLVPVGEQQKCPDNQKADGQRQQLRARDQGDGVADEADQREGAHPAEGIRDACRLVLFPLQSDEKRKEQHQGNLCRFRGQLLKDLHSIRASRFSQISPARQLTLCAPQTEREICPLTTDH